MPEEMQDYIEHYGFHFSKKAYDYAVEDLKNAEPYTKEQLDKVFQAYGIKLKHNMLYDAAYKMTAEKALHMGKSIPNEQYLAMHVQEDLDAEGNNGEETFREWMACRIGQDNPIDWHGIL